MLFTSGLFFVFLAVTFAGYYLLGRWQLGWLILASLVFYAYQNPPLLILLVTIALVDVLVSRAIIMSPRPRLWAVAGVACNVGALGFFKYNHLLDATFPSFAASAGHPVQLLLTLPLPIGISFYTLHGISLLLDTLRDGTARRDVAQASSWREHAANTLLYVSFFPQLIAGPITKAHQFYPQIGAKKFAAIDWDGAVAALITGYFLKSVIADNMSEQTFWLTYPYFLTFSSLDLVQLLLGYSVQIFADFAGYSLIAIGLAKLFGYNLPTNFRFPYISESFSEFWTRWHISLSSWMREYLYVPLGGNRKGRLRTYFNLMAVMCIAGLWHGAAWSYAVWGAWHGAALTIERLLGGAAPSRTLFIRILRGLLVFAVVTLGWLLFKLPHFADVIAYLHALWDNRASTAHRQTDVIIFCLGLPVIAYHIHYLIARRREAEGRPPLLAGGRKAVVLGLLLAAIALNARTSQPFIYFQF